MIIQNVDRELMSLHRASQDLQVPIRKAAHTDIMETGVPASKAPRGSSSSPSSYPKQKH